MTWQPSPQALAWQRFRWVPPGVEARCRVCSMTTYMSRLAYRPDGRHSPKDTTEGYYCYAHWMALEPCACGRGWHDSGYPECSQCELEEVRYVAKQQHRVDGLIWPVAGP